MSSTFCVPKPYTLLAAVALGANFLNIYSSTILMISEIKGQWGLS